PPPLATLSLHDALPIYRGAEVVAATLLGDDALVDAPGGEIAVAAGRGAHETLVVPEVEIALGAVLGNEHLAVLERAHGARVDVDVRIELDHRDLESPGLEDRAERGGGDPLAQRGHDATGDEYKTRHGRVREFPSHEVPAGKLRRNHDGRAG